MSFLKNHYEKIILAVLLVLFIALLGYQISVLMKVQQISVLSIIKTPEPKPDYEKLDFESKNYNLVTVFSDDANWLPIVKRSELTGNYFTDILTPYPLAECPFCFKIIPQGDFPGRDAKNSGRCLFCGAVLRPLKGMDVGVIDNDTNKNGIPDELELKWGLSLADSNAIYADLDEDGFTVLEEYKAKTDPTDPKSHPSYTTKLFVKKIERKKVAIRVKKILYKGDEPSKWEVQVDVREDKMRTRWPKVGEVLKVTNSDKTITEYKLAGIKKDIRDVLDPSLNVAMPKDFSLVTFERVDNGDKITGGIEKDLYEPRESIHFYDQFTKKNFQKSPGEKIVLGNDRVGVETFTVESSDPAKNTVRLKGADNKFYTIEKYVEESDERLNPPGGIPFMDPQMPGGVVPGLQPLPLK